MKKTLLAGCALMLAGTALYAGGPVMVAEDPQVVAEEPASSTGALVPLLLLAVIGLVIASGSDDEPMVRCCE